MPCKIAAIDEAAISNNLIKKKKWKFFFAEATDPNKKKPIFGLIGPTELTAFNGTEITITGEQRVGSVTLV